MFEVLSRWPRGRRWAAAVWLFAVCGHAGPAVAQPATNPADATVAAASPPSAGGRPRAWRLGAEAPPLRIDGRLDEPVWQAAPVHDQFVQYLPTDRQPAPPGYRTTLQVVVEDHALVVGIRAFDPWPQEIRAPLTRRDQVKRDQDFVAVLIDPVGTGRSAQFVRINAAGAVADGLYIADTDNEDFAPDLEFEAAVQRLPDGYSVELRLPLLSLRYPYEGGATWRMMVGRSIPRESSLLLLSAPLTKDALHFIAELQEIDGLGDLVERVRSRNLLAIRPELTLRSSQREAPGQRTRESEAALGVDLKWRPRADWVIDATLNPDFSQVELDVPQLAGNTRFALSVPEKRPFFLESTDVLDLPLAAFYSRSVTDPRWGVRATWRAAHADATAFSLRDDGGGLVLRPGPYGTAANAEEGSSQATLLRGRWHGERLTAGALVSQRDDAASRYNRVAGADLVWRRSDEQLWRARLLGSQTTAAFDANGQPVLGLREDGHHAHLAWFRRDPGWDFTAEFTEVSPRFRNDNGFVDQAGVRVFQAELIRRWGEVALPGPLGFVAHEFENYLWLQQKSTLADAREGIVGGEVVARYAHPGIWLTAASNTEAWVHARLDAERARPGGRLHPLRGLAFHYGANPAPWFTRFTTERTLGQRLDVEADRVGRGAIALVEAALRANLPNGWGLESEQRVEHGFVNAPDGRRAVTDTALRWLGVLHFDAQDSLRVLWQGARYQRAADLQAALAADSARSATLSIVFQRRIGLGRSLSLGATRQREQSPASAPPVRETELFAKVSWALDR